MNNKKLDTSQLLEECQRKGCPRALYRTIQMPFTCAFNRPVEPGCRFIFDSVDLKEYDRSLDQVEVVYGTLVLRGSDVKSFPRMPRLRQIEQKPGTPVLIIENNKKLTDITPLFGVNIKVNDMRDAVKISGNPKLCVSKKQQNEPFVIKFMTKIGSCSKFSTHQVEH
ncbi:receptor L domain protein [Ancylostoma caninum]|uniref:Receptor L domain protein n=1 Tax=Ancylostoma caninum TaxID=29170 RepID=A0A368GK06_ANCCA|nr:receptor L domain protein [Ancylostoma caninum]